MGQLLMKIIALQVPADGLMVSGQSLTIDESSMTGESLPVSVSVVCNILIVF